MAETYVIEEDGDMQEKHGGEECQQSVCRIETGARDLAAELAADIRRDIEEWAGWFSYRDDTKKYLAERKDELLKLCRNVEAYI